jgi:acetyltransferase-like isoleucine patch superfamily enzyme
MLQVAESAMLEDGAELGEDCIVWGLAQIRSGARLGTGCVVGRNVFIDAEVIIGSRCKIQNNALLYRPAVLGDGVFVGPAAVLTNDRLPRAINPDGSLKSGTDWQPEGVRVGDGASIGAGAILMGGVTVGTWALIGAGAVVSSDIADYALVVGVPARWVAWVGKAGARLVPEGTTRWRCPATGERFEEMAGKLCPL